MINFDDLKSTTRIYLNVFETNDFLLSTTIPIKDAESSEEVESLEVLDPIKGLVKINQWYCCFSVNGYPLFLTDDELRAKDYVLNYTHFIENG